MSRKYIHVFLLTFTIIFGTQCSKTNDAAAPAVTINTYNNKEVGASANEILSADKPNLVLEINYVPGYELQATTMNSLNSFLSAYTRKGSFQLVQKTLAPTGKDTLSLSEIDQLERKNRTTFNSSTQVSIYILITDSRYTTANTLGAAYRNTSIVMFGKNVHQFSGGINQVSRYKLETSTLEHEFGHLFGLVNVGSPMVAPHEDATHKAHCSNDKCLMYWETETTQMLGTLMNNTIPPFDQNCHNDIAANGGK